MTSKARGVAFRNTFGVTLRTASANYRREDTSGIFLDDSDYIVMVVLVRLPACRCRGRVLQ